MSIPVTNVPIAEYPYYYRCNHCTGAAFFLRKKPNDGGVISPNHEAAHADGSLVQYLFEIRCDACGKPFRNPSAQNVLERPDPLGVKDEHR